LEIISDEISVILGAIGSPQKLAFIERSVERYSSIQQRADRYAHASPREHRRISDLETNEMQDRQHCAVPGGVEKLVRVIVAPAEAGPAA
jgi:hypothetical protein